MKNIFFSQNQSGGGNDDENAEDYLNRLANSILSKENQPGPGYSAGSPSQSPAKDSTPIPQASRRPVASPRPDTHADVDIAPQAPSPSRPATPVNRTPFQAEGKGQTAWTRQVEMQDAQGNYLPGTILLFEDGNVGVFKESNPVKDYDIVYMLKEQGRLAPQGIPLYSYDVEPIGRLSQLCLDQMMKSNLWERDMIVFHLLKYRDCSHVPAAGKGAQTTGYSSATASAQSTNPSFGETDLDDDFDIPGEVESAGNEDASANSQLTRGRQLVIQFDKSRKWNAIYWGKDELGHVVAHNTHDEWTLMHLDLDRFKDSMEYGDVINHKTLQQMERQFAQ